MMVRQIENATLQERAYKAVKDAILRNELLPGEILSIENLAKNLGISQTPVREALTRLSADRLVEYERNKGFRVAPITEGCVREIYEIRRLLEPYAVRIVANKINGDPVLRDELLELEKLARFLEARISDGEGAGKAAVEECLTVDLQLNNLLLETMDNKLLKDVLDLVNSQSMRVRTFVEAVLGPFNPNIIMKITKEHLKIIQSMLNRDTKEAADAVREHLTNAEKRTLHSIRLALKMHITKIRGLKGGDVTRVTGVNDGEIVN